MRPFPLLLLLLLAGCAERWSHPQATEQQAEEMNARCGEDAGRAVPPQMVWQQTSPGRIVRDRQCRREGNQERCRVTERYEPPTYAFVDMATGPRNQWRVTCMQSRGFTFQGYRPLRFE